MSTKFKVTILIFLSFFIGIFIYLVIIGLMGAEPLVGLISLLTGVLLTELSHQQTAYMDRKQQMRLAALDRRLQTHQEAFTRLRWILRDISNSEKIHSTIAECQDWWEENCLYLTPDARKAFATAYLNSNLYIGAKETRDMQLMSLVVNDINIARDLIVKGVELPTISEGEDSI